MDNFEHALQKQNEAFRTQLVRAHAYCDEQEVPNGDDLRSRLEGWLAEERKMRQRLEAEVERLTRERDANAAMVATATQAGANLPAERDKWKARADAIPALQWEAEHLRAEALALKARAEAAEADNAALLQSLKSILFVDCCGPVDGLGPRAHVAAAKVAEDDCHPGAVLLERLRAAEKVVDAFRAYIEGWGVQHGDIAGTEVECPEDDTCACPHVVAINEAFAAYDAAREGV